MFRFTHPLQVCRVTPLRRSLRRVRGQQSGSTLFPTASYSVTGSALCHRCTVLPLQAAARSVITFATKPGLPPRVPLEKENECEGLVVGDVTAGIRSNELTAYERSDFIGQLVPLIRPRADAGDVLALIDTSAGHAAFTHISGQVYGGRFVLNDSEISMATVAFNAFMFSKPIFQGDLIHVSTRVIHAGASSIGVYIHVSRQSYDAPHFETVGESYVTMVVVDAKKLTVAPGHVPAVRLTAAVDHDHRREYLTWRSEARALSRLRPDHALTKEEVEHPENVKKKLKLKPEDCVCRMDRSFGVGDINVNKAIFGGEMLRFMEKCALHCGRVFARQARLFTLGMLDMTFDGPLFIQDLARCEAQVTFVRNSSLIVSVRVVAVDENGEKRSTNRAAFVLVAIDPSGTPYEIENGIDLDGASQEDLRRYWHGRLMLKASRLRRKQRDIAPPKTGEDGAM